MGDIKNYNPAEEETLDSREVAEMVEKQHKNLLRDINGYIENMKQGTELKIEPSEFFIPSTYTDSTGRKLPCFLVTKKGCEFIANKLTGEKGTKFTAMYVTRFNIMEEREKAAAEIPQRAVRPRRSWPPPTNGPRRCCSMPRTGRRVSFKSSMTGQAPSRSIRRWLSAISIPRMGFTSPAWPSKI